MELKSRLYIPPDCQIFCRVGTPISQQWTAFTWTFLLVPAAFKMKSEHSLTTMVLLVPSVILAKDNHCIGHHGARPDDNAAGGHGSTARAAGTVIRRIVHKPVAVGGSRDPGVGRSVDDFRITVNVISTGVPHRLQRRGRARHVRDVDVIEDSPVQTPRTASGPTGMGADEHHLVIARPLLHVRQGGRPPGRPPTGGSGRARAAPRGGGEHPVGVVVVVQPQGDLLEVVAALRAPRASRAACTAGNNNAIRMPMMAMTTNNSTRVKPRFFRRLFMTSPPRKRQRLENRDDCR